MKTHENDEVFDQILEHIIKNNSDLSNFKKFRRFRLQQQKEEENELSKAEKYKGAWGKVRRFWDLTKQATLKYMPKAVRQLWKLEKQSEHSAENAYRVVKQTNILRLKMKITDFASAILAALQGWLMFGEKSIYEDAYNSFKALGIKGDPVIPSSSTMLRVVCLIITVSLVFTIIKHY